MSWLKDHIHAELHAHTTFKTGGWICFSLCWFIEYSPLPGIEPGTRHGSQNKADSVTMCHQGFLNYYKLYFGVL